MRALFLADAHLSKPTDPNYRALLDFLAGQHGQLDVLVLLGDIFEFWIGKDAVPVAHAPLIDLLEKIVHRGTKLVYVEGNHDFHLGPVFTRRLNCLVLPDGGSIELDGQKIYLAHGDLANPDDTSYRQLRKFLRSELVRTLIRILPNSLLNMIAAKAGHKSRSNAKARRYRKSAHDILVPYAEAILSEGCEAIVTGHFHQPFHEKLGDGELIALGDWITQFSYAVYENRAFRLESYRPTASAT